MNFEKYKQDTTKQIEKMYSRYEHKVSVMTNYQNVESLIRLEAAELNNFIAATKSELQYELEEQNPVGKITMPDLKIPPFIVNRKDVCKIQTISYEAENSKEPTQQGGAGMTMVIGFGIGVVGGGVAGVLLEHPVAGAVVGGAAGLVVGALLSSSMKGTKQATEKKVVMRQKEVFSKESMAAILKRREKEVNQAFESYITGLGR